MKKPVKLLLTWASLLGALCLMGLVWHFVAKREGHEPNPIRPRDFPEILIAPEGAVLIDHSTPANTRRAPDTYSFRFTVYDPYPSDKTYKFIEEHLSSNSWQRLSYEILYPSQLRVLPRAIPGHLNPDTVDLMLPKKKQKGKWPLTWRREDWVNKDNELVTVVLKYCADLATKEVHRDKVYVSLDFFGRESWIRSYILKYKELHPEEFEGSDNLTESAEKER